MKLNKFVIGVWDDVEYDNLSYYSDIFITTPTTVDFEEVKKALMDARDSDDIDACSIDEVCDYVCENHKLWSWGWVTNQRNWAWNFAENETLGD
jgi:hypothetical protein